MSRFLPIAKSPRQALAPATYRMVGYCALVGVFGAVAALAFNAMVELAQRHLLTGITGYSPPPPGVLHPGGDHPGLAAALVAAGGDHPRRAVGRLHRLHLGAGGRGARHRRRHRRLPPPRRRSAHPHPVHQGGGVGADHRLGRRGRARGADGADLGGAGGDPRSPAAAARPGAAHPDPRRHGGRPRRRLPRAAGDGDLRRRDPLLGDGVRVGGADLHGDRGGQRLRRPRLLRRLAADLRHPPGAELPQPAQPDRLRGAGGGGGAARRGGAGVLLPRPRPLPPTSPDRRT